MALLAKQDLNPILIDGVSLDLASIVAVARYSKMRGLE